MHALSYDYIISGFVENVDYGSAAEYPCYIAINVAESEMSDHNFYFHASSDLEKCKFAERSKNMGKRVYMYCKTFEGANNAVIDVSYADTSAKFRYKY